VRQDEQQGLVERYTTAAVKFIKANQDKPFFLYLPHNAVHFPIYPGKKWAGQSPNGNYSDWVEEVDWSVGQVLDTLRELHLESRTLVLFTSDNGGTPRAVNAPLRGFKGSTWEGGMREPTIAWWPGNIPAGTSSDAISGMFDVLPTLVKLAGGHVRQRIASSMAAISGRCWPARRAQNHRTRSSTTTMASSSKACAPARGSCALRPGNPGKMRSRRIPPIGSSFTTSTPTSASPPTSPRQIPSEVARLRALADAMKDDLGLDGIGPGVRPLGRVANPQPLIGKDGKIREGFEPK
jgi:arylsulfatase A